MNPRAIENLTFTFGVFTLALALVLMATMPSRSDVPQGDLPEGFATPIIAFEFARSAQDLDFLSGDSPQSQMLRAKMDAGHWWDAFFPFAYGGFLFFLALGLVWRGARVAWLAIPFALLAIPFDLLENQSLLALTKALGQSAPVDALLVDLHLRTWLKWGSIALAIFSIALGALTKKERLAGGFGLLVACSAGLCWMSGSLPPLTEMMALAISIFFFGSFVKISLQLWRQRSQSDPA